MPELNMRVEMPSPVITFNPLLWADEVPYNPFHKRIELDVKNRELLSLPHKTADASKFRCVRKKHKMLFFSQLKFQQKGRKFIRKLQHSALTEQSEKFGFEMQVIFFIKKNRRIGIQRITYLRVIGTVFLQYYLRWTNSKREPIYWQML